METRKKYTAQERYESANVERMTLKLNHRTDADILAALEGKAKQTEVKRLLRVALALEQQNKRIDSDC